MQWHYLLLTLQTCLSLTAFPVLSRRQLAEGDGLLTEKAALQQRLARQQAKSQLGIVIPAGGKIYFQNAAALIGLIRKHHRCQIPIEVYYSGQEEYFAPAVDLIKNHKDVKCIDATSIPQPAGHRQVEALTGYVLKVFALYVTSYPKVLLLDADNLPLIDPQQLFSEVPWQHAGNLFWPDYFRTAEGGPALNPEAYKVFDLSVPWETDPEYVSTESGEILFDRERHSDVLEWLWFLSSHSEHFSKLLFGDKDLFRLAFSLANKTTEFKQVAHPPRSFVFEEDDIWRQLAMGHSLEDGTLVFFHRGTNGAKIGSDGELNPIRRYWPSFLSSPITSVMSPKTFGWDDSKQMLTFNKDVVEASDFHCSSHSSHRLGNLQAFAICPWDGSDKVAKAKFAPSGGMQAIATVLKAFEGQYDKVLEATSEDA